MVLKATMELGTVLVDVNFEADRATIEAAIKKNYLPAKVNVVFKTEARRRLLAAESVQVIGASDADANLARANNVNMKSTQTALIAANMTASGSVDEPQQQNEVIIRGLKADSTAEKVAASAATIEGASVPKSDVITETVTVPTTAPTVRTSALTPSPTTKQPTRQPTKAPISTPTKQPTAAMEEEKVDPTVEAQTHTHTHTHTHTYMYKQCHTDARIHTRAHTRACARTGISGISSPRHTRILKYTCRHTHTHTHTYRSRTELGLYFQDAMEVSSFEFLQAPYQTILCTLSTK
jgi:hypothetical protein